MTYAATLSAVAGASVTGVTRAYTTRPISVQTADLPASFVELPNGSLDNSVPICDSINQTRNVTHVVLVEAAGQEMTATAFGATVAMVDNVVAMLNANEFGLTQTWTINAQAVQTLDGVAYWGVVTNLSIRGD